MLVVSTHFFNRSLSPKGGLFLGWNPRGAATLRCSFWGGMLSRLPPDLSVMLALSLWEHAKGACLNLLPDGCPDALPLCGTKGMAGTAADDSRGPCPGPLWEIQARAASEWARERPRAVQGGDVPQVHGQAGPPSPATARGRVVLAGGVWSFILLKPVRNWMLGWREPRAGVRTSDGAPAVSQRRGCRRRSA